MYKRFIIILSVFAMLPVLSGCGGNSLSAEETKPVETAAPAATATAGDAASVHIPQPGEDLATALDNAHLKNMDNDLPVKVEVYIDHGGPAETAELTDSESIAQFVSYFSEVSIKEETLEMVTDNYNWFAFTFSDGESVSVSLNLKNLEFSYNNQYHIYVLSDFENLWSYMNSIADYPD